ncbi:MAG: 5-(carboxyamino)imidazole ribonucleotide synthase [Deltaproteobacteria bacterium]|nr:5-(carboxyamino)imidazole ribonucleotide synthase [Deltaproteobacteria bacterium]
MTTPILPGATLGILGGGQLGRMTAMAARALGYHIHCLDPDPSCAARFVVDRCLTASFEDDFAAADLARHCAVVTLEIEKVSQASLAAAGRYAPVRPSARALAVVQDRGAQRAWLAAQGAPQGPWRLVTDPDGSLAAVEALGGACFFKACTGGYDGRSQAEVTEASEAREAFRALGGGPCVVEARLAIAAELSVLVARTPSGAVTVYPPAKNHHQDRVLTWSVLPGPLEPAVAREAEALGLRLAEALGVEGLLVLELFLTQGGALFVNELAPRPHNTFHATEVACLTSQFEQCVRAVCDLPLGSVEVVRPAAIYNLFGDLWLRGDAPAFDRALALPGVRVHLYGKRHARPGRKMGHLSATGPSPEEALARVRHARTLLGA